MTGTTIQLPRPASGEHLNRIARAAPGAKDSVLGMAMDDEWTPVAAYPALEDGADAAGAVVSVIRMPAMFYRIASEEAGIDLTTGTDMHDLAHDIAEAICGGMLGVSGDDTGGERP
jgi:hypothetical protein